MSEEKQEFQPTIAGNTGTVYSKKGLAKKKARIAKAKKALEEWGDLKDKKVKCLVGIGAVHIGHPTEKTFGGHKDQIITIKEVDAKALVKAGLAEEVK